MIDVGTPVGFSREARRVLTLAQEESAHLNHWLIGTEHLLLALVRHDDTLGNALLTNGVMLERARSMVREVRGSTHPLMSPDAPSLSPTVMQPIRGGIRPFEDTGLTPRASAAIDHAVREAQRMNDDVRPAHLMLGVLRVTDGVAGGVLRSFGVDPKQLEKQIRSLLGASL